MSGPRERRVAVLGNGPVGQTTALLLARWGVPVVLVDARPERDPIGSKAICQQRDVLDVWESVGAGRRIATEGVTLDFTEDAIDAMADAAVAVNTAVENIGARRLQTIMEKVTEDLSFRASDLAGQTVTIGAAEVKASVGELAKDADLSRFIL